MATASRSAVALFAAMFLLAAAARAQDPAHATERRMRQPGNGPDGRPRIAFLTHCLGTDHAEGISVIDLNHPALT